MCCDREMWSKTLTHRNGFKAQNCLVSEGHVGCNPCSCTLALLAAPAVTWASLRYGNPQTRAASADPSLQARKTFLSLFFLIISFLGQP